MFTTRRIPDLCIVMPLAWIAHFFIDFMLGIWPVYKTLAHVDLAQAGLIVAAGASIGEGSQLLFGPLSDKGYTKWVMLLGVLAAIGATFLTFTTNVWLLFGLYLTVCIGSGAFHPAAAGLMNSLMPTRRGLLMSIFATGGSLGLASSQLIFSYIYSTLHVSTAWLALPGIMVGLIILFYRLPHISGHVAHKIRFGDFIGFMKRRDLRLLYIATVANQTLLWAMIFILPDVLRTLDHSDLICFGGGHLCLILGGFSLMIPSGYLADRYSPRGVMLTSAFIAFFAFYTLLFMGEFSPVLTLVLLYVLGASLMVFHPIALSLGGRLVPDKPSTISAFLMGLVWVISEALGPGGVGLLSTLFTDYAPVKALAVLGSCFLVNIYAVSALPKEAPDGELVEELARTHTLE